MTTPVKHLRSATANKRPTASGMVDGRLAINTASGTPGLYFVDNASGIVKVGPAHVGSTAPNVSPAGSAGNSLGELWVNNSTTINGLNYYTGAAFVNLTPSGTTTVAGLVELATDAETQTGTDTIRAVTPSGLQSKISNSISTTSSTTIASATAVKTAYDLANAALPKSGGRVTGALEIGPVGSLVFEGSSDDGFETTLAVVNPTADRTITFPNVTGTVVTTGDSNTVTGTMIAATTITNAEISASAAIALSKLATGALPTGITIASGNIVDGTIINADINASAAIAGTKISPNFGSQNVLTTGTATAASLSPTGSSVPTNGVYLPAANSVAISTNGTGRLFVDAGGRVGIGTTSPNESLEVAGNIHVSGADRSIFNRSNNALTFGTNNTERARIDSSGRLLVGTSSAVSVADEINGTQTSDFGLQRSGATNVAALALTNFSGTTQNARPSTIVLARSRGAGSTHTAVAANDQIGAVSFQGSDGTNFIRAASIKAEVDGTPGANDMPGRLVFSVTLDGAASPTEALRITNDRVVAYNQAAPAAVNATATLTVDNLKNGIITSTTAAAVTMTLPTGTLTEGGFSGVYTNMTFEWSVINTGATNAVTVQGGTGHTLVGSGAVAAGTSGRFASRRTAANTFVSYRLS